MRPAAASRTVQQIADALGLDFEGDGELLIRAPAHPDAATADQIALAMDPKYLSLLERSAARAAMTPAGVDWRGFGLEAAIFAPRARYAMAGITALFAPPPGGEGVHATAVIDPSARIGASAVVGPYAVVGAGSEIGAGGWIGPHVTIGADVQIGEDALIKSGARIGDGARIGRRVIVHENAVIGSDGFSFVTPEPGAVEEARARGAAGAVEQINTRWARIHSLGSVIIGDDVEVGACATVDRGTVADTRVGDGSKIDNHGLVAHNVSVGDSCLLCGHAGVAGSAKIGDRVVLGGQAGVGDHSTVDDDAMVMAASAVSGTVKSRTIVGGVPALPRDEATRIFLATKRLPRLFEEIEELKKRFSEPDASG